MAIPLLSLVLGVRDAVILALIFQFLMGLLIIKSYRDIDWHAALPMSVSIIVGAIVGSALLSFANTTFLQLFLVGTIVAFLLKMTWLSQVKFGSHASRIGAAAAGLGGGLFQGLIGTGGPILTMYLAIATTRKEALRATLIYLLFITCIVRIGISVEAELFTDYILKLALITLPFFLIAIFIGQQFHQRVSERYYRLGIYFILTISALMLVKRALG